MITGYVSDNREAVIALEVFDGQGHVHEIEAVIDTGFTGYLTLPPMLIGQWQLIMRGYEQAILADGQVSTFEVYQAAIAWHGQRRRVEVDATDSVPLIGMGLLYGSELRIQAISGGSVTVDALPEALRLPV